LRAEGATSVVHTEAEAGIRIDGVAKNDGRDKGGSKSQKLSMTIISSSKKKRQLREAVSRAGGPIILSGRRRAAFT